MTGQAFSQSRKPNYDICQETKVKADVFNVTGGTNESFKNDRKVKRRSSTMTSKKKSTEEGLSPYNKNIKPCIERKLKELDSMEQKLDTRLNLADGQSATIVSPVEAQSPRVG